MSPGLVFLGFSFGIVGVTYFFARRILRGGAGYAAPQPRRHHGAVHDSSSLGHDAHASLLVHAAAAEAIHSHASHHAHGHHHPHGHDCGATGTHDCGSHTHSGHDCSCDHSGSFDSGACDSGGGSCDTGSGG